MARQYNLLIKLENPKWEVPSANPSTRLDDRLESGGMFGETFVSIRKYLCIVPLCIEIKMMVRRSKLFYSLREGPHATEVFSCYNQ